MIEKNTTSHRNSIMTLPAFNLEKPSNPSKEILALLFRPMGVDGVYGRTGAYEDVVDALGGFISRLRPETAEVYRFPPVVSRALIEKSGYLKSFPHLLGCVCALDGDEARVEAAVNRFEAGGTWTDSLDPSELVLAPAACYPIYPIAARARPAPAGRASLRRRRRLFPPRTVARNRSAAIFPHAGIRRDRAA